MVEPNVTYEEPRSYTPNNVVYWEETSKKLRFEGENVMVSKANKFLQAECIERKSETQWICKPIKDYNKTTHTIVSKDEDFVCSCQGFAKKEEAYLNNSSEIKPFCSHIIAVKQFCFLEGKNENRIL